MKPRLVSLLVGLALGIALMALPLKAHWRPNTVHNQLHAINLHFCGTTRLLAGQPRCLYGRQAAVVARLESGGYHWYGGHCRRAVNGQYRGCFQMGSRERRTYGHGPSTWAQAKAAHRYWKASGRDWSPWSCKPWEWCLA